MNMLFHNLSRLILFSSLFFYVEVFSFIGNNYINVRRQHTQLFEIQKNVADTRAALSRDISDSSSLNELLDEMKPSEKYALLLQSYSSSVVLNKNSTLMVLMENLYAEMLEKAIEPTKVSSSSLINAASRFSSSIQLSRSIQLIKAGKMRISIFYNVKKN
jgi:hypothetical protein